ncbi:phosphotransferase [Planomonospora sp. ID82291]|uniref:phosphotransferase n=1 Tax=Planomonospora sp. ID82291 TaxID=2738136 RepID=UPI0018C3F968|nr:phosphotransferase [Planomonospora sp. ID82291]MBG0818658.1 phosphotransferase [Planomonospora sp. ID82291]
MTNVQPPPAGRADAALPVAELCERFGLGTARRLVPITTGLMNRNWHLETAAGSVAVKEITDADAGQTVFQHRVTAALADAGLPVPRPRRTADGRSVLALDGRLFSVVAWVDGQHLPSRAWSRGQCQDAGVLLGRSHRALAVILPDGLGPVRHRLPQVADAQADIDRYQALIGDLRPGDAFDRLACAQLDARRALLERLGHLRPDDNADLEPAGYVHGDFHDLNLLWDDGGQVVAVVDWDRLGRRAYAYELARAAILMFAAPSGVLDTARVAAFAAAYRTAVTITDEQVLSAVRSLWWDQMGDLWHLRRHYLRSDSSCDHLLAPSGALLKWWSHHLDRVEQAFTTH